MVWRDIWGGTPNVVVLAWEAPQRGLLVEAALITKGPVTSPLTVYDREGNPLTLEIPEEHADEAAVITDLDLKVITLGGTNEN